MRHCNFATVQVLQLAVLQARGSVATCGVAARVAVTRCDAAPRNIAACVVVARGVAAHMVASSRRRCCFVGG
jgi:hypothetical protein